MVKVTVGSFPSCRPLCLPSILDLKWRSRQRCSSYLGQKRSHLCVRVYVCVWTPLSESLCGFVSIRALLILSDKKRRKKKSFSLSLSNLLWSSQPFFKPSYSHCRTTPCLMFTHDTQYLHNICSLLKPYTLTHTHNKKTQKKKKRNSALNIDDFAPKPEFPLEVTIKKLFVALCSSSARRPGFTAHI